MACRMCQERGKTWDGDDPRCAFEDGEFGENWNCATVNAIRDICYEGQNDMPPGVDYHYCEDQKYATVQIDHLELDGWPLALWVSWYKSRGATDSMWMLFHRDPPRKPTEAECLRIIEAYGSNHL